MSKRYIYAKPRVIFDIDDCYFYHTMELPGYGIIEGEWDLRGGMREYLGGVNFKGKRVLEIGTASGFCCFWMEKEGADVVAFDLSKEYDWDVVPFSRLDYLKILTERKMHIDKMNNGYWLAHRVFDSTAKVVYGSTYDIPAEIGPVDISTFCLVLPHVRDPFLALQSALRLTKETIIVVGSPQKKFWKRLITKILEQRFMRPGMYFWPEFSVGSPWDTWWLIPEEAMARFLGVLGFARVEVNYHYQKVKSGRRLLYTMVGHRVTGKAD